MNKRSKEYYVAKALELCFAEAPSTPVTSPSDLYPLLQPYGLLDQEHFIAVTLNGNHGIIRIHEITKGIVNRTLVHPREIFRAAVLDNATSVILAHNHPSGNLEPSREDKEATKRLDQAGKLMGIQVMDHLIIGPMGYYSFREQCLL